MNKNISHSKQFIVNWLLLILLPGSVFCQSILISRDTSDRPDSSALLEIKSQSKGFLLPRLTTIQRNNILNPAYGLLIINSTLNKLQWFDGTGWKNTDGSSENLRLQEGLLANFPFSGNTNDQSGNYNNGFIAGTGSITSDKNGMPASAYKSNGNPDRVIVFNNGSIAFDTAFTVAFSVMMTARGRINFVSMSEVSDGRSASFAIGTNMPGNNNLNFGVPNSNAACGMWAVESNSTNNTAAFIPELNVWYHITCTYNKGVLKIYVNGTLISSVLAVDTQAHVCPGTELILGGWSDADPTSLIGKLDEVRIYNRALHPDEIAFLAKPCN